MIFQEALAPIFTSSHLGASAILSPGREPLTFAELDSRLESVAGGLRALGVERGDVVAIAMPEGPDLLIALLGVMRAAAAAPLDASLTEAELRTRLALTSARCLIARPDSRAAAVARELAMPVVETPGPELRPDSPCRKAGKSGTTGATACPTTKDQQSTSPVGQAFSLGPWANHRRVSDDITLILQTSATTAAAKLVPLTYRNLDAICNSMRRGLALRSTDVYLSVMPLHHIVGFSCAVGQLLAGGPVVCAGGFDALRFAPLLKEFQPTWYSAGPALHRTVLQLAKLELAKEQPGQFAHNSLRFVRCGTGAASPALLDELERTLEATVVYGYGLTEVGSVTNTIPHLPRKRGSAGRSIGPEICIMDSSGNLLPPGEEGEVVMRGECVMPGYLDDPVANRETFRDGWFRTGDLGRLDEEGDLFVTGRIKEIINRGGESIAPIEVDHALTGHPAVAQAAAFAVPHPSLGEDVAAAVVLHPGATATAAEIRSFLAGGLSRARIPTHLVFVESIPLSTAGKPLRKVLSERFAASCVAPRPSDGSPRLSAAEQRIAEIWASVLGKEPGTDIPGRADDFFALGGDSLSAARMIAAVDEQFDLHGKLWERVEFFDSPTVGTMADIVGLCATGEADELRMEDVSAVFLQARGAGAPIFFFAGENLSPWYFRHLVRHLGEDRPFIVLRHQFTRVDQFHDLAGRAVSLIGKIRSSGPLVLAGHCYGGIFAYEAAQRLSAAGRSGVAVVLMDTPAPGYPKIRPGRYLRHLPAAVRALLRDGGRKFASEIAGHVRFLRSPRVTPPAAEPAAPGPAVTPAGIVLRTYRPKPFQGNLGCVNAGDANVSQRVLEDPRLGWRDFTRGRFLARQAAGRHSSMFEPANAPELAREFQAVLRGLV